MDPDTTLSRIRLLVSMIHNPSADLDPDDMALEYGGELAELVGALDEWMSNGGYVPARWTSGRA